MSDKDTILISYREFWRNFGKYKSGSDVISVVGKGGEVLGTYFPAGTEFKMVTSDLAVDVEGEIKEEPVKRVVGNFVENAAFKRLAGLLDVPEIEEEIEEEEVIDKPKCFFCKNLIAEWRVFHQEVGDEYIERLACCICIKKLKSTNCIKI